MSRYRSYGARDESPVSDLDPGFVGVDCQRNPMRLEAGLCANAVNKLFNNGTAETRKGIKTVGWAMEPAVDFPLNFNQVFFTRLNQNPAVLAGMTFRVYDGTTLQIYNLDDLTWHALWIEMMDGHAVLAMGPPVTDWVYSEFIARNASYRLAGEYGSTLQIVCPSTGLYHSIWLNWDPVGEYHTIAVDPVGMAWDTTVPDDGVSTNWRVTGDGRYLELYCPDTLQFHAFWIKRPDPDISAYSIHISPDASTFITETGFDFDQQTGFGVVYGAVAFSDPNGREGALIATRYGVYRVAAGYAPEWIRLPFGEQITAPGKMVQAFDRVIMLRGEDQVPLVWYPAADFVNQLHDFEYLPDQTTPPAGSSYIDVMPNSDNGIVYNNRLYLVTGRDTIVVSDILDYTRYDSINNDLRINSGTDDSIIALQPWTETTLLVFKDQSVYLLSNCYGDLSQLRCDLLTREYGLVARKACCQVGKDVWFLSDGGVFSVVAALDNKLQGTDTAISSPIAPLIERINWPYVQDASMVYHDNHVFLSVPLDGSRFCNAILVYSCLNKRWAGYWTGSYLDIHSFIRVNYGGRRELFVLGGPSHGNRKVWGALSVVGFGMNDQLYDERADIVSELVTRGYAAAVVDPKRAQKISVDQSTWNPVYTVAAISEGVGETVSLSTVSKSRTNFMAWGKPDYEEDNSNDDHSDPDREDYSVMLLPDSEIYLGSGVNPDRHQRVVESWKMRGRGVYTQLTIRCTQGRCDQHTITVDYTPGERGYRVKA